MARLFSILLLLAFAHSSTAQVCMHTELSKVFNFKTEYRKIKTTSSDDGNPPIVTITVIDKRTNKEIQKIYCNAGHLSDNTFKNCAYARSYSTHYHEKDEVVDNDFGTIVVADFNFDNKEDLAVVYDEGGNGGPLYNFYIQQNGKFILDKFLTEQMQYFPETIDSRNKTLTITHHLSATDAGGPTYQLDPVTHKWKELAGQ